MPRFLKIFRPNKHGDASTTSKSSARSKKSTRSIFRRSDTKADSSKQRSASVSLEQAITWTMSEESVSPSNVEKLVTIDQSFPLAAEPSPSQDSVQSKFLFTEEDLIENEMNHIQALTALESDINKLKKTTDQLVLKHAAELLKKDEEYVELLIQVGEREEELAEVRAELASTKRELGLVSCKLIQTQHQHFEDSQSNFWTSLFRN